MEAIDSARGGEESPVEAAGVIGKPRHLHTDIQHTKVKNVKLTVGIPFTGLCLFWRRLPRKVDR